MIDRVRGMIARLRAALRPGDADRDLRDEIDFHVEMEIEEGIRRGLPREEARRRALVSFGGVDRFSEEVRRLRPLAEARQDARVALRLLRRTPVFTTAAVLTLALGIGANTAVFSVVESVLLRPSPFRAPDRLVMLWETDRDSGTRHEPASWPDVLDFRERSRSFQAIGSMAGEDMTLTGPDAEPERVAVLRVTPNFLTMLGVHPVLGRLFSPGEGAGGGPGIALLGEETWRTRFHGDSTVVGRTITLDGKPVTVVGVAPASADFGIRQIDARADYGGSLTGGHVGVWLAMVPSVASFPRETHPFLTLGRLAPGVGLAAAQRDLASISASLDATYPVNKARGVNLESFGDVVFGPVRTSIWVLLGAAGLVLLVGCVNLANLLLARMSARTAEVAVRRSLGAGTLRLARQFFVESAALTAIGAVLGLIVASGGLHALQTIAPADIPRLANAHIDGTVLAFTVVVSAAVAIAFGLLPIARIRKIDLHQVLEAEGGRTGSEGRAGRRFREGLVVVEIALAVALVTGAGLLLRSFWNLQDVNPGFRAQGVLEASLQLPSSRYPQDYSVYPRWPRIQSFESGLAREVRRLPGVEAAALAGSDPLDPGFTNSFVIVGREAESKDFPEIRTRFISPGYLKTLGVHLLSGRDISSADDAEAPAVVLINKAAERRYFPDSDPIGHELSWWGTKRRIVGVVANVRFEGLDRPADPAAYAPLAQAPSARVTLLLRTRRSPLSLVPAVRQVVRNLDPQIALFGVGRLDHALSRSIAKPRFTTALVGLFAALAMILAFVGVYGVVSYTASRRAPEVGVRLALGARQSDVVRHVMLEGMSMALIGTALGVGFALLATGLLRSLLFDVTTTDPLTFTVVPAAVLAIAACATWIPARRASRADPMEALRAA